MAFFVFKSMKDIDQYNGFVFPVYSMANRLLKRFSK